MDFATCADYLTRVVNYAAKKMCVHLVYLKNIF